MTRDSRPGRGRLAATMRLHFRYAGQRILGITTSVSLHDLVMVSPAQLPAGGIMVLDIQTDGDEAHPGPELRIIAQVTGCAPAPFGGADAVASEMAISAASLPSWQALLEVITSRPRLPPADPGAHDGTVGFDPNAFLALYRVAGVWFRGEVVLANAGALWVRTVSQPPRVDERVLIRIPVLNGNQQVSIEIDGRTPTAAVGEERSPGWLFEVIPIEVSPGGLYQQLVDATAGTSTG